MTVFLLALGACGFLVLVAAIDNRRHLRAPARMLAPDVVVLLMIYGDGQQLFDIGDPFGAGIISTEPER